MATLIDIMVIEMVHIRLCMIMPSVNGSLALRKTETVVLTNKCIQTIIPGVSKRYRDVDEAYGEIYCGSD